MSEIFKNRRRCICRCHLGFLVTSSDHIWTRGWSWGGARGYQLSANASASCSIILIIRLITVTVSESSDEQAAVHGDFQNTLQSQLVETLNNLLYKKWVTNVDKNGSIISKLKRYEKKTAKSYWE